MENINDKESRVRELLYEASTNLGIPAIEVERTYLKSVPVPYSNFSYDQVRKLEMLASPHWKTLLKVWEIQHG